MLRDGLTKKQKALVKELEEMHALVRTDFWNVEQYERESWTTRLELMKRHIVIGEIVIQYTLIDEHLNVRLCRYFFGRTKSFLQLWRAKRFKNFNHYVLEQLSLLEKLRFAKAITPIPKGVSVAIERINDLRNGLAHSFFPENLRRSRRLYKGKDIFSTEGISSLIDDMAKISEFFAGDYTG